MRREREGHERDKFRKDMGEIKLRGGHVIENNGGDQNRTKLSCSICGRGLRKKVIMASAFTYRGIKDCTGGLEIGV